MKLGNPLRRMIYMDTVVLNLNSNMKGVSPRVGEFMEQNRRM